MRKSNFDYKAYWERIYKRNGTSGTGSYGPLAEFKGDVVNNIIDEFKVESTIDFGCGDGNQIKYMNYIKYTGFDVSPSAIKRCTELYKDDPSKGFHPYDPITFDNSKYKAHMVTCLDVLYHITDEEDFIKTLDHIFACAEKVVVLYTTLVKEDQPFIVAGMKHRNILPYVEKYSNFEIKEFIYQKYPNLSTATFLIFKKI